MSNLDENLTTEYLYGEPLVQAEPEPQKGTGIYRFLAIVFFLLGIGGLFIGMLASVAESFMHAQLFFIAEPSSAFSYSLLGLFLAICNSFGTLGADLQACFEAGTSVGLWYVIDMTLIFLALFAAVFALVLMIITICTKSHDLARKCAITSGILLLLTYGGLFLISFFEEPYKLLFFTEELAKGEVVITGVDWPSAVIACVTLIVLGGTAIARRKVYGFLSTLLLVLTIICIAMLNYPTAMVTLPDSYMVFDLYDMDIFLGISLTLLVVVLAFNFFVSALRLHAKKGFGFDVFRYGLQLFAVVLTIIAFMISPTLAAQEKDLWAIFSEEGQTLATVLLLVCSIAALVVALLASLLKKKNETVTTEVVVSDHPTTQAYEPAYVRVSPYETYAPIVQPVIVQPQVVQQPQPQVVQPQVEVHVQQPPEKDIPLTEFERKMQAIARGDSSVYDTPKPAETRKPAEQQPYARTQRYRRPEENTYVYEGSQYMYDPFIKTLTVQEKNEFGDLFISNIYGLHSYLPTYVIGGDNKTFFERVFIYLGNYRNYISQELLEKIYLYVSKQ